MFTPTAPRDEEPEHQETKEAPSETEEAAPEAGETTPVTYPMVPGGFGPRARMLAFAVFVGAGLALVFSFVITILLNASSRSAFDRGLGDSFLSVLVTTFGATGPWFILVAAIVVGVDALMRNHEREAHRNRRALVKALSQTVRGSESSPEVEAPKRAADIVQPLIKDLNLDLDK